MNTAFESTEKEKTEFENGEDVEPIMEMNDPNFKKRQYLQDQEDKLGNPIQLRYGTWYETDVYGQPMPPGIISLKQSF